MKRIAVVTGSRAEYGILSPVLKAIDEHPDLSLSLWVTGMHLLQSHGNTIHQIRNDGWNIHHTIPMYEEKLESSYALALSRAIAGFDSALSNDRPDWLIVLGDRLESFAAVQAASLAKIPIAHIHGGDRTSGANIDESIRHAISRFAHIHFPASQGSASRLAQMGEEEKRIFKVGAPSLDTILSTNLYEKSELSNLLNFGLSKPFILCVQHSVTSQAERAFHQMNETLCAIQGIGIPCVLVYPNNDVGHQGVIKAIESVRQNHQFSIHKSFSQRVYLSLLKHAHALVGNSSSGLIEAPSFGLPMVHVGNRNEGREHGGNVLFVSHDRSEIEDALTMALYDSSYRSCVQTLHSPFGDGRAGERIADVLANFNVDDGFFFKPITF